MVECKQGQASTSMVGVLCKRGGGGRGPVGWAKGTILYPDGRRWWHIICHWCQQSSQVEGACVLVCRQAKGTDSPVSLQPAEWGSLARCPSEHWEVWLKGQPPPPPPWSAHPEGWPGRDRTRRPRGPSRAGALARPGACRQASQVAPHPPPHHHHHSHLWCPYQVRGCCWHAVLVQYSRLAWQEFVPRESSDVHLYYFDDQQNRGRTCHMATYQGCEGNPAGGRGGGRGQSSTARVDCNWQSW